MSLPCYRYPRSRRPRWGPWWSLCMPLAYDKVRQSMTSTSKSKSTQHGPITGSDKNRSESVRACDWSMISAFAFAHNNSTHVVVAVNTAQQPQLTLTHTQPTLRHSDSLPPLLSFLRHSHCRSASPCYRSNSSPPSHHNSPHRQTQSTRTQHPINPKLTVINAQFTHIRLTEINAHPPPTRHSRPTVINVETPLRTSNASL